MNKRWAIGICLALLTACNQAPPPAPAPSSNLSDAQSDIVSDSLQAHGSALRADIGLAAYTQWSQASQSAQKLDASLASFLYQPDDDSLTLARNAWRRAYSDYLKALVLTHLPLSDPPEWRRQQLHLPRLLERLDSWPIEPGYIDYLPGYPFSGIVNDLALELSSSSLLDQHGFSDPSYASLGYHPLEFMLWGSDGTRSAKDFLARENTAPIILPAESDGHNAVEQSGVQNHHRRRDYLRLVSEQLQKDLQRIQRRWQPSEGYYAQALQNSEPQQVLYAVLTAAQSLVSDELLQRRLNQHSSSFSMTSLDDVQALSDGLFHLLIPTDAQYAGLIPVLPDALLQQWQTSQQRINDLLLQWRSGQLLSDDARQQLRESFITLLSLLQQSADSQGLTLPRAG
jgi:putative iron-regulated protein